MRNWRKRSLANSCKDHDWAVDRIVNHRRPPPPPPPRPPPPPPRLPPLLRDEPLERLLEYPLLLRLDCPRLLAERAALPEPESLKPLLRVPEESRDDESRDEEDSRPPDEPEPERSRCDAVAPPPPRFELDPSREELPPPRLRSWRLASARPR